MDRRSFLTTSSTMAVGLLVTSNNISEVFRDVGKTVVTVLKTDHINGNGRIYPREVIERVVADFVPSLGELIDGYRTNGVINLSQVSHSVEGLFLDGDNLKAEITVLGTPNGMFLSNLLSSGEVSFRTFGTASYHGGTKVVNSDYKLIGIDAMPIGIASTL